MLRLQIYKYPHDVLTTPCTEVDIMGPQRQTLLEFIEEMVRFYNDPDNQELKWGIPVGLAANQVGKPLRLFIALGEIYINPIVTWKARGGEKQYEEGCYSLEDDKFNYRTIRAYGIRLKWQDINGEWFEKRFNGHEAQVIQHEMDHLEGRLCNE